MKTLVAVNQIQGSDVSVVQRSNSKKNKNTKPSVACPGDVFTFDDDEVANELIKNGVARLSDQQVVDADVVDDIIDTKPAAKKPAAKKPAAEKPTSTNDGKGDDDLDDLGL